MCETLLSVSLKTAMPAPLTCRLLSLAVAMSVLASVLSQTQQACDLGASVTESIDLPLAAGKLAEVHIRHNLKGSVVLENGLATLRQLEVRVEKTAETKETLSEISVKHALLDISNIGMVLLLQLDYTEKPSSLLLLVGGSLGVATVFMLICLAIAVYHKRSQQLDCPLETHDRADAPEECAGGQMDGAGDTQRTLDGDTSVDGHENDATGCSCDGAIDRRSLPVPPPPCGLHSCLHMSQTTPRSACQASGRGGKPSGLYRNTVVTFSLVSLIVSVVYGACHHVDTQATVIVTIPPQFPLGAVKLFFNKKHRNEVTIRWQHQNITSIDIFDLDDASHTNNPPCSAKEACPDAYTQNLGGCDPAGTKCVCQRGYQLTDGLCTDVDECLYDVSPCRDDSVCHNYIGSYLCICGPRFYYRNDRCTSCSGECPEGQFESQPCSESSDRLCSVCSRCEGSTYEITRCQSSKDTQCIHVAHPALLSQEITIPSYREVFRVNASSNVFLETLFGARDLETTPHYITNNKQMIDFFWFRDSGMRISIGVEDINILPLYEDVSYESDNKFMLNYPNTEKEKEHFVKIIRHHCRNPIPDYYSLTLEISRDRSTKAENIICNSSDPSRPSCPDNYADGDTYVHRSLNDACTKMGAFPEVFHGAANSIICLHETDMLHDIFNQTAPPVRSIRFAPKRCRPSIAKCEQCLTSQRCQLLDQFQQRCCKADCYTLASCKAAKSNDCATAPVECAMGDAYRYTIEPMFKKLSEQFQCHIHYRSPPTFYRLWFYITVPGTDFETPRRYHTVHASDVPSLGSAFHTVEFITVEHYTGVQLHNDFILIGQENQGLLNRINFTVQPKKFAAEYQGVKPNAHKISNTVFVSSIQFEEPFAYSTSKWVRGRQCEKDMSRITGMQPHYKNSSQAVKVVTDNMEEPYTYLLSSATSRPYMRLFVPGNMSILSWFFHKTGPVLLTDASLSSNITINDDHTAWTINIEGRVSGCPAYLGVTISDQSDMEEIMKYDLLVSCPPQFNLTLVFPTTGEEEPVHTFHVQITDSQQNHTIFLTHLTLSREETVKSARNNCSMNCTRRNDNDVFTSVPMYFVAVVTLVVLVVTAGVVVLVYFECTRIKWDGSLSPIGKLAQKKAKRGCCSSKGLSRCQYAVIVTLVVYKIIYAFVFTFTAFSTVLLLYLQGNDAIFGKFGDVVANFASLSLNASLGLETYTDQELERQRNMTERMYAASEHYLDGLMIAMAAQMEHAVSQDSWHKIFDSESSVRNMVHSQVTDLMDLYSHKIANYTDKYFAHLDRTTKPAFRKYRETLNSVYFVDWLTFPQALFNGSEKRTDSSMNWMTEMETKPETAEEKFARFLKMNKVEDIHMWKDIFKNRYKLLLPAMPVPTVSWPDLGHCGQTSVGDDWVRRPTLHRDSLRYVHMASPTHFTFDMFHRRIIPEQTTEESPIVVDPAHSMINVGQFLFSSTDMQVLQLMAVILDVLLIWHRLTRLFVTARMLCANVEETVLVQPPGEQVQFKCVVTDEEMQEKLLPLCDIDGGAAEETPSASELHNRPTQSENAKPKHNGHLYETCADHDKVPDSARTGRVAVHSNTLRVSKFVVANFVLSNVVPTFVITSVFLLLVYCVTTVCTEVMMVTWYHDFGGLLPYYMSGLDAHHASTWWFMQYTAQHHSMLLSVWYRWTVQAVMAEMKSLTDYFNSEQGNLTGCLPREPCATDPHMLNIPTLSSNFVPIQPQPVADHANLKGDLSMTLEPVLLSASGALVQCAFLLVGAVAVMVILHVIGTVVFRYIRTHRLFPVSHVYLAMFGPPDSLPRHGDGACDAQKLFLAGDTLRSPASSVLLMDHGTSTCELSSSNTFTETKV